MARLPYQKIVRHFLMGKILLAAFAVFVATSAAVSDPQLSLAPPLNAILEIKGQEKRQVALSLVTSLIKLRYPSPEDVSYDNVDQRTNFVFLSHTNAIVDGYVNIDLLGSLNLNEEFLKRLTQEQSESDSCYVQSYPLVEGGQITFAVFND